MKTYKKYVVIITLLFLFGFNSLALLLRNRDNYTDSFYVALGFVDLAGLAFIIISLILKDKKTGVAGIHPMTTFTGAYFALIVLISMIMFFIPNLRLILALVPYLIVTFLWAILLAFSFINVDVTKREYSHRFKINSLNEIPVVLETFIKDAETPDVKSQLEELLEISKMIKAVDSEEAFRLDKMIFEYVRFIEKNIHRKEESNIHYNTEKLKELIKKRIKLS